MKPGKFLVRGASASRSIAMLAVFISLCAAAQAQSGRRLPNRNEPPPPSTTTTSPPIESTAKPQSDKPPKMQIMVVRYQSDGTFSTFYSDIVLRACLERLKADSSALVSVGRDMNRKEATDYAKNSTDTYVLWLEWDYDRFGGGAQIERGSYVNFNLYVPGTGKTKTSGRVHQSDYRPRVGGIPLPTGGTAAAEYALKECGQEIARRIIESLSIGRPNRLLQQMT
jgi:hypothetical protein